MDPPPHSPTYVDRVNRAVDHVMRHLASPLRLADVAEAACFSPFHFHRVFKALTGETLHDFVKRQRLDRALRLMSHAPARSLTRMALDCGFASSSDLSRSFRQRYGVAPRAFDMAAHRSAHEQALDAVLQAQLGAGRPTQLLQLQLQPGDNPDGFQVRLRDLPSRTVAYLRVPDPYRAGVVKAACERLMAWADARGLAGGEWLGYLWDEPEITSLRQCRYDVAVVVDDTLRPGGGIGCHRFAPLRVAEVTVRGDLALEARAIDWLYRTWLPTSGYVPDDQPMFEAWAGRPYAHGEHHVALAVQMPVRRS